MRTSHGRVVRRDERGPVRLLKVRGDLCDRFRRSDPDGTGEAMLVADRALNLPREILCVREAAAGTNRDIEEALLDSTRLQPVRERPEGVHDLSADPTVEPEVRGSEHGLAASR